MSQLKTNSIIHPSGTSNNITFDSNGNVTVANNVLASTVTANTAGYFRNTYFSWSSMMANTISLTGYYGPYGTTVSGSLNANTVANSVSNGYYLTTTTSQTGHIFWNIPGFDYSKDFEARAMVYHSGTGSATADGCYMAVAANSAPATSASLYNTGTGIVGVIRTYTNQHTFITANNAIISNIISWHLTPTSAWVNFKIRVKTIGGKRMAYLFFNDVLENSADVSNVSFNGTYVYVGGVTGGVGATQACNAVELVYI